MAFDVFMRISGSGANPPGAPLRIEILEGLLGLFGLSARLRALAL